MLHETDESSRVSTHDVELITKNKSIAEAQNSLSGCNEHKSLLSKRLTEKHACTIDNYLDANIHVGRNVSIAYIAHITMQENTGSDTAIEFYKEWPGRNPTVNISWFIAKAYLGNLYYTTQRDLSLTIKTCDDIIDVFMQAYMNRRFAEKVFPVLLSTQWTCIYDKEIPEVIGFYSL